MAADLRLERSASGVTIRFPHPVGLSAMEKDLERGAGIEPASSAWKAKAQSHQTNPARIEGFVCRFTAPRLHATDRSVRRTWAGVLGWFESVDPRSLPYLSAPGLAPEARPIRIRSC